MWLTALYNSYLFYWGFLFLFFAIVSRLDDRVKIEMECKKADAIVLTYACDQPQTIERLSSYWLPELRQLEVCSSSSLSCLMANATLTVSHYSGTKLHIMICPPCAGWTGGVILTRALWVFFLQIKVPVIVVGCKLDLRDDWQPTLEQVMAPLMHEFREIETCIECSSIKQIQVLPWFLEWCWQLV
jgi:Ras family protein T1